MTAGYKHSAIDARWFAVLDTEAKAYWAGFLLADGCVIRSPKGSSYVVLRLSSKDEERILELRAAVGSTRPVTRHIGRYQNSLSTIRIGCRPMADDLARYGVVPRKTKGHPMPEGVAPGMMRHFLRGYFDGDGHIGRRGHKTAHAMQYQVAICGTHGFCLWMQEQFCLATGVSGRVSVSKGCSRLDLGGNPQVSRWMEWMYADSTVFLERKRSVAMECVRLYGSDAARSVRRSVSAAVGGEITIEEATDTILAALRRESMQMQILEMSSKYDGRRGKPRIVA